MQQKLEATRWSAPVTTQRKGCRASRKFWRMGRPFLLKRKNEFNAVISDLDGRDARRYIVLGGCEEGAAGRVRDPSPHKLLWLMCVHSLYKKPATTAAKIEPIHRSSIHPSGNRRGIGDQAACPKLPGTPAQNPTIIPILRAVFGPGPAVARAHA